MHVLSDPIAQLLGPWAAEPGPWCAVFRVALAVLLAAVIGWERSSKRHSAGLRTFMLISLAGCAAYLEEYLGGMEDGLRREAPGLYLRPRFSPGYGDLDISHQWAMFDLLEVEKRLGLSLTQTHMMLPEKSVTAIAGLSDVPGARVGGCAACAKTDCPNRRMTI